MSSRTRSTQAPLALIRQVAQTGAGDTAREALDGLAWNRNPSLIMLARGGATMINLEDARLLVELECQWLPRRATRADHNGLRLGPKG